MCFVATKVCLSQPNICQDRIVLSRQVFVMTNVSLQQKHKFVTAKLLSRQAYFCHNKRHVLSGQTNTCFCRDKTFRRSENYTCGSPHQWYKSAFLLTLSVFGSCEKWTLHHWLCYHIYYVYKSAFLLTLSVFGSCEKWTLHHWFCCHIYYVYKSAFLLTLSVFGSCEKWTLHHWLCCHIYYVYKSATPFNPFCVWIMWEVNFSPLTLLSHLLRVQISIPFNHCCVWIMWEVNSSPLTLLSHLLHVCVNLTSDLKRERERGKNTHRRSIKLQSQYLSSVCYLSVLVVCHDKSPTVSECHQIRLWRLWRWTREEKEEETDCVWVCVAESCWARHGWSLTSHTRPLMSFWSASDSTRWVPPQCTQRGDQGSELRLGPAISVGRMSYQKARC